MSNRLSHNLAPSPVHHAPELAPFEVPLYLHHAFHVVVQFLAVVAFGGLN